MRHETVREAGHPAAPQEAAPCRYGGSRLLFRGPPGRVDGSHMAFLGGSETFGRFLDRPFPALLQEMTGAPCINLGQVNGGVDAMVTEPAIVQVARDARLAVVEVTGALNLSNRFYIVHPRRNDRFVAASPSLRALYPEVDFAEICFTRHLASRLHAAGPERWPLVRAEAQAAWLARMRSLLAAVGPRVALLWLAREAPPEGAGGDPLAREPPLVTRAMVDALRPLVREVVAVVPSAHSIARGREDLAAEPEEATAGLLGAAAHLAAAAALAPLVRQEIGPSG